MNRMKRITTILILFVVVIFVVKSFPRPTYVLSPYKAEVVETWQSTNTPFQIRIQKHIERGGFMPVLGGAYYDFQSAPAQSNDWQEIMSFRHDDPVEIPKDAVHFTNERVAFLSMGWLYAVTTDGGRNWRVSESAKFLTGDERCGYNCIEDLRIDSNGWGEVKINLISSSAHKLKILQTADFGETWHVK
jgi:hypothetical protein